MSKIMMNKLEEKILEISNDNFNDKLSLREKAITDRATLRAEIMTLSHLLEYQHKLTTEAWRIDIRELLTEKIDRYYKEFQE